MVMWLFPEKSVWIIIFNVKYTTACYQNSPVLKSIGGMSCTRKILPLRHFISSVTDSLSSLRSFSNCDDTTVYSIVFYSEATNMDYSTENSTPGAYIDS